jgi:hypothetical protein
MPDKREIYFHEDDYCQQQLLPCEAAGHAVSELKKIDDFAAAHRAPGGMGWTDVYARRSAPVEFKALKLQKENFAAIVAKYLRPYDLVNTGYSSHREVCKRTAAWGTSSQCALFADWDDDGLIANVWAEFFDRDDESIAAATKAVVAIGTFRPLVYVDWAWGYICEAQNEERFASMLRSKLKSIAKNS